MLENSIVNLNALCKIAFYSSELIFAFLYAGSIIKNASQQFLSWIYISCLNLVHHPTP
jgi:hypothetical protein